MRKPEYWAVAELLDFSGLIVAQVRLHVSGLPPGVLVWGTRTFVQSFPAMRYCEAISWLVPPDQMYHHPAPALVPDAEKPKP